jgi:hypothetical protein
MKPMEEKLTTYILENFKPRAIILHGSRAFGMEVASSDWDFLLLVDEFKGPDKQFVDGEKVSFSQILPPFALDQVIGKHGMILRKGMTKIIYDPDGLAQKLLEESMAEEARGVDVTANGKISRSVKIAGILDKIIRYKDEKAFYLQYVGEFLTLTSKLWFHVKEKRHNIPPYMAIPYLKEKDPDFYTMLNMFAETEGEDQKAIGEKIISYLLG